MAAAPVANHHAVETPVLLQDFVQHSGVMTVVLVLIQVVGTHDAPGTTLLHSSLEGRQINLVQCTVAHNHVHLMTILLVVVQGIVLHAGCYTFRLQSLYVGHHHA